MKIYSCIALLVAYSIIFGFCNSKAMAPSPKPENPSLPLSGQDKMNGLTFVAPPEPFPVDPFEPIKAVGANWIAVVPYGFTRPGTPKVHYGGMQWWGETPEGVCETVRTAHLHNIHVMLKPQVYVPGSWTGVLDFPTQEECSKWEQGYEDYIMSMARIADSMHVELFCIGTEFKSLVIKHPEFWSQLIDKVRAVYKGKLTYSSNWDDWESMPFWDKLDYIGLGGYFPLVDAPTPSVDSLVGAWQPIALRLKAISEKHQKPVLFTEYGYLSVDGCGWRNWELEQKIQSISINEQAQANCLEALHRVFQKESYWAGAFLWKWFPNMQGHEGYPERDYTPQGKVGEKVLKKWFEK